MAANAGARVPQLDSPSDADRSGSDDIPTDDGAVLRRERAVLNARRQLLQGIRGSAPTEPPGDLDEAALARRLAYDMVHQLARSELVILQGVEVLEEYTAEQRTANKLKVAELAQRDRELAILAKNTERTEVEAGRRWAIVEWLAKGFGSAASGIARDPRISAALASAVTAIVSGLVAAWGYGHMIPTEGP